MSDIRRQMKRSHKQRHVFTRSLRRIAVVCSALFVALSFPAGPVSAAGAAYTITDLGGTHSEGCAINAQGQVAGFVKPAVSGLSYGGAFLYTNGTMVDVGVSGRFSRASGVNARGQVM